MQRAKGNGFDGAQDGTSDVFADVGDNVDTIKIYTADAEITEKNTRVLLNKGSAMTGLTIAAPTATVDDGKRLKITTISAQAHVITDATAGFNGKGSSGTITFTAAKGNSCELLAYQGVWYVINIQGVTVA